MSFCLVFEERFLMRAKKGRERERLGKENKFRKDSTSTWLCYTKNEKKLMAPVHDRMSGRKCCYIPCKQ